MFPAETYANSFLQEEGFIRKQCPSGPWFWTLDPETVYSGIQPEVQYTFIGKQVFNGSYSLAQIRKKAVDWFATQGHKPMESYPVLASLWRNDLLFTSASICDFQPHVIDRLLEPPANPVVVAQKCVRLNDLENIGRSGRHLSSFTMLGHHAFNFEGEEEIYWIANTVRLCHRFFTEELGADGRKITYVEAAWAGGGNAGPCFEVIYEGIEVATLVFMSLREAADGPVDIKGVRYEPMPTRVVDTGYGLERIVWASQGTANIYEAVSPKFVKDVSEAAGVQLRGELIDAYFSRMSGYDIETPLQYEKAQAEIAGALGVTVRELSRAVRPAEMIFTLCDFTRTILLMLNDHVLPSNKDAGYLVRHLAKRIMTMISEESVGLSAMEIVGMQFDAMVGDFPELAGKRETAIDIIRAELERHEATMERGRGQLIKEIQKLQKSKSKVFPEDKVFFYYDTLGLPLPYVREIIEEESDLEVEISDGFWDKFFNKSMALDARASKPVFPAELADTRRLYYEDPYARGAEAKVTGVDGPWVALDQTVFFPEGGGQPADHGTISIDGSVFEVVDTQVHHGTVFHRLSTEVAPKELIGESVKLSIDWDRRYALMRNHSATHLLNATLREVLGFHIRQMGAQKGVESSRFDISHYQNIGAQELAELEARINEVIFSGAPISTEVMRRGDAEDKYGFFIYQGGFVPFDNLRIVSVGDLDTEACAGTHLRDIQEASLFKFLGASQTANNVYRLRYTVGPSALEQFQEAEKTLDEVIGVLNTQRDVAASKVANLLEENRLQGKLLTDYETTLLQLGAQASRDDSAGPTLYFFKSPVPKDRAIRHLIRMARTDKNQAYFVVFSDGALFVRSKDLGGINFQDHADRFSSMEVLNATQDMIVFGGEVEAGAAWDAGRKVMRG